jgi:DNA-binding transcriptional MerR regulator
MAALEPGEMSIGDLASSLDVTTATINFYVKEGILPPPRKLNRTRAAYSQRHARLLRLLRRMQASGYALGEIRRTFEFFGTDDEGVSKLEGIGTLQPLPPVWNDPKREQTEHFDPVPLDDFAERIGVDRDLIEQLERDGLLRPRSTGTYDASDAWMARTADGLVRDGVPRDVLTQLGAFVPVARTLVAVIDVLMRRHADAMARRELRMRDLHKPLLDMMVYVIARVHDEELPNWRGRLFYGDGAGEAER